jgi:hypothetical protein
MSTPRRVVFEMGGTPIMKAQPTGAAAILLAGRLLGSG